MIEPNSDDVYKWYESQFYANALYGLISAWIERRFHEPPEIMGAYLKNIMENSINTKVEIK